KIQIPTMQSAHCQMRVGNALKSVEGLTINNIEPGVASISVEHDLQQNDAIKAIEKAGYNVQQINEAIQPGEEGATYQFKTNINCEACVAKVTPTLNNVEGISHWEVNTNSK